MRFNVEIDVMPKAGISDPQGQTIERALPALGFSGITEVRVGKRIEFSIEAADQAKAESAVKRACESFLSNPVIEDFRFTFKVLEASNG
jgi:phosphoribosylformylglycinamidine synthase